MQIPANLSACTAGRIRYITGATSAAASSEYVERIAYSPAWNKVVLVGYVSDGNGSFGNNVNYTIPGFNSYFAPYVG
jgi:hypothetical protein